MVVEFPPIIETPTPPEEVVDEFVAIADRVVWCSLATVDRRGRPRSRVVHPIWQRTGDGLVGWVVTRPTPLKVAHLAHSPFVSCSYWDPAQDVAVAECRAQWEDARPDVHELFRAAEPPLGFDPATMPPDSKLLRLEPWRLRAGRAERIAAGEPALAWRRA